MVKLLKESEIALQNILTENKGRQHILSESTWFEPIQNAIKNRENILISQFTVRDNINEYLGTYGSQTCLISLINESRKEKHYIEDFRKEVLEETEAFIKDCLDSRVLPLYENDEFWREDLNDNLDALTKDKHLITEGVMDCEVDENRNLLVVTLDNVSIHEAFSSPLKITMRLDDVRFSRGKGKILVETEGD